MVLKTRAREFINKHLDVADTSFDAMPPMPENLRPFLDPLNVLMTEFKNESDNGQAVIKPILHQLSDQQLDTLKEIMGKVSGRYSEEKLLQMAPVVMTDIAVLDTAALHVAKMKSTMLQFFVYLFADEYCQYSTNGNISYNNEQFRQDVQSTIDFRKGQGAERDAARPVPGCIVS